MNFVKLTIAVALCVTASAASAEEAAALIGTWKIVAYHDDGHDRMGRLGVGPAKKDEPARIAKLIVTPDEIYVLRGDGQRDTQAGLTNCAWTTYKLNATSTPRQIDIASVANKQGNIRTYHGVYALAAGKLQICWPELKGERPTEFASDGEMNLFICERISDTPELPSEPAK